MKKIVFLFLGVFAVHPFSFAQQRKKITENAEVQRIKTKIVYEVLKSDPTIKDGLYRSFGRNALETEGYYSNGQRNSSWQSFGSNGIVASRSYSHGKRTGKWEFFDQNGQLEWSYDFNTIEAFYTKPRSLPDTTTFYYQDATGDWIRGALDKKPVGLYGQAEWIAYLMHHLYYPQAAQDNEQQGTVEIAVTINENGEAIDYRVAKSPAESLNEVSLSTVKNFYHEFLPAEKNGKKIKALYIQPITFRLETSR